MAELVDTKGTGRHGRLATGFLAAALAVGGLAAMTGTAGAAPGDPADAITAYDTYPAALPAGCDGPNALLGLEFSNGGRKSGNLSDLTPLQPGPVTMTWTGFAEECKVGGQPVIGVSLASYRTIEFRGDAKAEIQALNAGWQHEAGATAGPYTLTVDVPADPNQCYRQLDAVLGQPLARVGFGAEEYGNPSTGSYYNNILRGDEQANMLVSSWTSAPVTEVCVEVTPITTTTTTTTTPTTPTTTPTTETTPTVPETTTSTSEVLSTTPTPPAEVQPVVANQAPTQVLGINATRATTLPQTGAGAATPWLAGMSALLLAAGAVLAGQGRRLARRSA